MSLWRTFFAFTAFYNVAFGAAMTAAAGQAAAGLGVSGPGGPYAVAMVGLLIAIFGVGYAMVARDPARNRGIVWVGLLSKIAAPALGAVQYVAGAIPFSTFAIGMVDLAFAFAFALFLWRGPR